MQDAQKLYFRLPEGAPYATESVWAEYKTDDVLVVRNSPFYAKGISCYDEVNFVDDEGLLYFHEVVKKNGHSTYRILQQTPVQRENFEANWRPLQELGCSYESKVDEGRALYSVDIPPEVNIRRAYDLLEQGEKEGVWVFEEADYGGV